MASANPNGVVDAARIAALRELDPDGEGIGDLINEFIQDGAGLIAEIRLAIARNHMTTFLRGVHTMKGVSANLGAALLSQTCVSIESQVKGGGAVNLTALLETLEREYARAVQALSEITPHQDDVTDKKLFANTSNH